MIRIVLLALSCIALLSACVSVSTSGAAVRVTSNPEAVKGCRFMKNVNATSGWGGAGGTGLAESNTEKTLQNRTAELGGDVLFLVAAGIHSSGEAYSCAQ